MRERLTKEKVDKIDEAAESWKELMSYHLAVSFDYNVEFVTAMDDYIERLRLEPEWERSDSERIYIGLCLGKCLIQEFHGEWVIDEEQSVDVLIGEHLITDPIGQVYKQLKNGSEDSILGLFTSITTMLGTK